MKHTALDPKFTHMVTWGLQLAQLCETVRPPKAQKVAPDDAAWHVPIGLCAIAVFACIIWYFLPKHHAEKMRRRRRSPRNGRGERLYFYASDLEEGQEIEVPHRLGQAFKSARSFLIVGDAPKFKRHCLDPQIKLGDWPKVFAIIDGRTGNTLLHYAVMSHHPQVFEVFSCLFWSASAHAAGPKTVDDHRMEDLFRSFWSFKNKKGLTPLELARRNSRRAVTQIVERFDEVGFDPALPMPVKVQAW